MLEEFMDAWFKAEDGLNEHESKVAPLIKKNVGVVVHNLWQATDNFVTTVSRGKDNLLRSQGGLMPRNLLQWPLYMPEIMKAEYLDIERENLELDMEFAEFTKECKDLVVQATRLLKVGDSM